MPEAEFAQVLAADRRLAILRLLVEARGEAGESSLEKGLHMWGFRTHLTREVVRRDLEELAELRCLRIELVAGKTMIATITDHGRAAARGAIDVPGVSSPSGV